jgi:hypothetical protein
LRVRRDTRICLRLRAMSSGCAILRAVRIIDGIRSAIGLEAVAPSGPTRTVEASALLGPTVPKPELASPWTDRSVLETITLANILGDVDPSTFPLERPEAMAIPAVSRARGIVCSALGRLDLNVYTSGNVVDVDSPAAKFISQPDPNQSRYIQLLWSVDDMIFHGVSWWLTTARYAEDNRPRAATRILPGGVQLQDGGKATVYGKPVDPADLIRIDGPHEGILYFASRSLRIAASLEASAARFAANPTAHTELHQTDDVVVPRPERDALIAGYVAARQGKNGGVSWTTRNLEVKDHGAAPEHLLTNGRNAQAIDSARHIGVPADAIDASPEKASQTYANRTDRLGILVDFGLAAYGTALTARLSMADITPAGRTVAFDYDGITAVSDSDPDTAAPKAAPAAGGPTA